MTRVLTPAAARMRRVGRLLELCVPTIPEIASERPVLPPLLVIATLAAGSAAAIAPLVPYAFPGDAEEIATALSQWIWIGGALTPLAAMLKSLVLATLAWAGLTLAGVDTRVGSLFSLMLYGEAVLGLRGAAMGIGLRLGGVDRLRSTGDLFLPTGLDVLGLPEEAFARTIVMHLSIFHLAWLILMVFALPRCTGCSRRISVVATSLLWGALVGISLLRSSAGP